MACVTTVLHRRLRNSMSLLAFLVWVGGFVLISATTWVGRATNPPLLGNAVTSKVRLCCEFNPAKLNHCCCCLPAHCFVVCTVRLFYVLARPEIDRGPLRPRER